MPADITGDDLTLTGPIVIDLTDVKTTPVDIGWHSCTIMSIVGQYSKKNHKPQLAVQLQVCDEGDPDFGQYIFPYLQLTGRGRVFTTMFFQALEMDTSVLMETTNEQLQEELVGRQLDVKVNKHTEGEAGTMANCSGYEPYGSQAGFGDAAQLDLGLDG